MTWVKGSKLSKNNPEEKLRNWPRRTHTNYDGYDNEILRSINDNSKVLCQSYNTLARRQDANRTLLLLSLIEELCVFYESDAQKRRALFNTICQSLSKTKILEPTFSVADLENMRLPFRRAFSEMVNKAKLSLQSLQFSSNLSTKKLSRINIISIPRPLPSSGDEPLFNTSRYLEEFEELEVIGKGGFGVVCKALKRVDRCIYAVKKINFRYTNYISYQKILREVELLARLNHPNVVAYKTAWIENQLLSSGIPFIRTINSDQSLDLYIIFL
ncbi:eukaryotic translation initiation factor 2-alpha kinase 1-like [Centruroides vittatus]|uniref:eukaryotic translation initiation factor 2-alpha kinase 1-like n=1 Tax=Centruroides vittatus TaxID=120091 RepID=UPI003510B278